MTNQEKVWFSNLSAERAADAKTFAKPEYRGVWNSVIDKYSDNAHFVYELLQNADDAGATEASFTLVYEKGITFEHNGTKHFTVSNPNTSEIDQQNGRLGCVNAISAIGQSAKIVEEKTGNQIGKFGIGFKSVFRYTNTPRIYDDNICFELHDRIVPILIDDFQGRECGKTVICLPFNRDCDLSAISKEIESSILKLQYPLLFLNNLKSVVCRSLNGDCVEQRGYADYRKEVDSDENVSLPQRDCIRTRQIRLTETIGAVAKTDVVRTMERVNLGCLSPVVCFKLNDLGRPVPLPYTKAFCYFQTDVETGLKFLVHAPFKLVENRQGIVNDLYNVTLVGLLAQLAADSVLVFKHLRCLDEGIFDVIPGCDTNQSSNRFGMFSGFPAFFVNLYTKEAIYKTESGYASLDDVRWPASQQIKDLLPEELLGELFDRKYLWAGGKCPDVRLCKKRVVSLEIILNRISESFVENRGVAWLNNLYELVLKNHSLMYSAAVSPIVIDTRGHAVAAKDKKGGNAIYLPIETECDFPQVSLELMKQSNSKDLFSLFGLRKPSRMDAVKKIIVEKIPTVNNRESYDRLFKQVLDFYIESNNTARREIINLLKDHPSLVVKAYDKGRLLERKLQDKKRPVYYPSELLKKYLAGHETYFVDRDRYLAMVNDTELVDELLEQLGIRKVVMYWLDKNDEPNINFCRTNLDRMPSLTIDEQKRFSFVMWRVLCELINNECSRSRTFTNLMMSKSQESKTLHRLRTSKWVVNDKGEIVAPSDVWIENLASEYNLDAWQSRQLVEALKIQRNPELVAIEKLTEENRKALDLGKRLMDAGVGSGNEDVIPQDKIDVLLRIGKICSKEDLTRLLEERSSSGVLRPISSNAEGSSLLVNDTPTAMVAASDNRMSGLSQEEQQEVLIETKKQVEQKLKQEGFEFTQGLGEYSIINGVIKDGVEYPLVVHSYKDSSRTFQLTAEDWNQLMRPNSMLMVRTSSGICSVPFLDLVRNREKIELSFSTTCNLDSKERLEDLARVMRWFKGLHFDFGTLIPVKTGTVQLFDLPEQVVDEEEKQRHMSTDNEEVVF